MSRILEAEPLDSEAFRPFGEVAEAIGTAAIVNLGTASRFETGVRFDLAAGRTLSLAVFRAAGTDLPFRPLLMERHLHSSQLFVPMALDGFLVMVAEDAGGRPDMARLRAFLAGPGQAVNYRRRVWHHPIQPIGRDGDLAMIMGVRAGIEDCETAAVEADLLITADGSRTPLPADPSGAL